MVRGRGRGPGSRLLTCAAVAACIIAAAGCRSHSPAKPVLPAVPQEAFAKPWTERQVFLIGIGDSITDGYGASQGRGYFDLLVKGSAGDPPEMKGANLSAVMPRLKATDMAMSGSTSAEHLKYQVERMAAFPADTFGVAVITTGGNDCIHNYGNTPPRTARCTGRRYSRRSRGLRASRRGSRRYCRG